MPDSSTLEMPGAPSGGKKGIPDWVIVVGAVAGIAGVVLLLRQGGGSSSSTVAAGTSINAALGSIQEENMNLLGTTQAGFMQTGQQIASGFSATSQQIGGVQSQELADFTSLTNQVTGASNQEQSDAAANIAAVNSGFTNLGTGLSNLSAQVQGYQQTNAASFQNINTLLGNLSTLEQTGQANSAAYSQNLGALMNELSAENLQTQNWVDEIKARLQSGNYSQAENGPSGQGWQSPGQGYSPLTVFMPIPMNSAQVGSN
jgi:hypothetical protein